MKHFLSTEMGQQEKPATTYKEMSIGDWCLMICVSVIASSTIVTLILGNW